MHSIPYGADEMVEILEKIGKPMTREKIGEVIHLIKDKMGIGAAEGNYSAKSSSPPFLGRGLRGGSQCGM
ncbi:hypothetical protein MNBD_PLANCTO02-394 [hydrothermal vent metagenome]|uniref:Uncharacterized protein n=1 Tax=hydrothermal vent metagenome TaxID=652676 RepID=A0A3B1DES5_9ZZZZ